MPIFYFGEDHEVVAYLMAIPPDADLGKVRLAA
jgi:hypothetical protein